MSTDNLNQMSAFDIFAQGIETLDDAKKKSNEESRKATKYLRFTQDGTYPVRILPLAPVIDADGNVTIPRKGYEYPVKEIVLKIHAGVDSKGKDKTIFVSVTNAKYAFPDLKNDLIDLYVQLVCEKYASDEALCKKVRGTSFNGGLKYDSKRCIYVFDADKRGDGMQILQLSYSQYKDVEERKIALWEKLAKKDPKALCPISSIQDAYILEITRKTDNGKTGYTFNIDTLSSDTLSEDELNVLLSAPRLPEVIYRYTRYHLEATIAYLNQYDELLGINIMKSEEIKDCIDQIKMLLPADDQSHFSVDGKDTSAPEATDTIDALWNTYDTLVEQGLEDKSEEGQELRASIKEFIEENELDIRVTRQTSNHELLMAIDEALNEEGNNDREAEEDKDEKDPVDEKEATTGKDVDEPDEDEEEDDDEPKAPSSREVRNDDTNEPAARPSRRSARPMRRH